MASSIEKRQHIRIPSSRPIVLMIGDKSYFSTLTDFSEHGIGFLTTASVTESDRIELHFEMPHPDEGLLPFQLKAEVMHCMHLPEQNHVGVRIDSIQKDYSKAFLELYAA